MFKIDRADYLSVLPIIVTVATTTLITPFAQITFGFRLEVFALCAVNVILGIWLWLQWPRTRLTFIAAAISVLILYLRTSLSLWVSPSVSLGRYTLAYIPSFLKLQCFCFLAASACALILRSLIGWRFLDALNPTDDQKLSSKGTIRDLGIAVALIAITIGMFRSSGWRDHLPEQMNRFPSEALAISITSVVILLFSLRAAFQLSVFSATLLTPTLVLIGGLSLGIARGFGNDPGSIEHFLGLPFCSSLGNFTIALTLVMFALLCRALNLVLRNPDSKSAHKPSQLREKLVAVWAVFLPLALLSINLLIPYGRLVGTASLGEARLGWPLQYASWTPSPNQISPFDDWSTAALLIDIFVAVSIAFALGYGIIFASVLFFNRVLRRPDTSRQRSRPFLATVCCLSAVICLCVFAEQWMKHRRLQSALRMEGEIDNVSLQFEEYQPVFANRIWSNLIRRRPDKNSKVVVGIDIGQVQTSRVLRTLREFPFLRRVVVVGSAQLTDDDISQITACQQLEAVAFFGNAKTPLDAGKKLLKLPKLLSLAIGESKLPKDFQIANSKFFSLRIELSHDSAPIELPQSIELLTITTNAASSSSPISQMKNLYWLIINQKNTSNDVVVQDCPALQQITVQNTSEGSKISISGTPALQSLTIMGADSDDSPPKDDIDDAPLFKVFVEKTQPRFSLSVYAAHIRSFESESSPLSINLGFRGLPNASPGKIRQISDQFSDKNVVQVFLDEVQINSDVMDRILAWPQLRVIEIKNATFTNDSFKNVASNRAKILNTLHVPDADLTSDQIADFLSTVPQLSELDFGIDRIEQLDLAKGQRWSEVHVRRANDLEKVRFGRFVPKVFHAYARGQNDIEFANTLFGFDYTKTELQKLVDQHSGQIAILGPLKNPELFTGLSFGNFQSIFLVDTDLDARIIDSWKFSSARNSVALFCETDTPIPPEIIQLISGKNGFRNVCAYPKELSNSFTTNNLVSLSGPHVTFANLEVLSDIENLEQVSLSSCILTRDMVAALNQLKDVKLSLKGVQLPSDALITVPHDLLR